MIEFVYKKTKDNTTELKVISCLKRSVKYADTLDEVRNAFSCYLSRMDRINAFYVTDLYKLETNSNNELELWHFNATGDKDRLVAKVIYKNPSKN